MRLIPEPRTTDKWTGLGAACAPQYDCTWAPSCLRIMCVDTSSTLQEQTVEHEEVPADDPWVVRDSAHSQHKRRLCCAGSGASVQGTVSTDDWKGRQGRACHHRGGLHHGQGPG